MKPSGTQLLEDARHHSMDDIALAPSGSNDKAIIWFVSIVAGLALLIAYLIIRPGSPAATADTATPAAVVQSAPTSEQEQFYQDHKWGAWMFELVGSFIFPIFLLAIIGGTAVGSVGVLNNMTGGYSSFTIVEDQDIGPAAAAGLGAVAVVLAVVYWVIRFYFLYNGTDFTWFWIHVWAWIYGWF